MDEDNNNAASAQAGQAEPGKLTERELKENSGIAMVQFDYLKALVKHTGLRDIQEAELKENLNENPTQFILKEQHSFFEDKANAILVLKKDEQTQDFKMEFMSLEVYRAGQAPMKVSFPLDKEGQPLQAFKDDPVVGQYLDIVKRERNLNHVLDQVKFTGFGDAFEQQIKDNISKGLPAFDLEYKTKIDKDEATALLHFRKSETQDNYFFNRYDLSVLKEGEKQPLKQTFFIGFDNNYTLKEGYNLLSGRAVFKEMAKLVDMGKDGNKRLEPRGEKYKTWLKLDLTDKHPNGNFRVLHVRRNPGFDLEKEVGKLPIKEEEKAPLILSLQKGNIQSATAIVDNKQELRYMVADLVAGKIIQYDAAMKPIGAAKDVTQKANVDQVNHQQVDTKNSEKQANKQSASAGDDGESPKKQTKAKGKSRSVA